MNQSLPAFVARAGYAARGIVYLLIGGLAVLSAAGYDGRSNDSRGASTTLVGEPWGFLALIVIGLALCCC